MTPRGEDFDGLIRLIGGWPWEAQAAIVALAVLVLALYLMQRKPKPAPKYDTQRSAIDALAESIARAGKEAHEAHLRVDRAERVLNRIFLIIDDMPPPDIAELKRVVAEERRRLNER